MDIYFNELSIREIEYNDYVFLVDAYLYNYFLETDMEKKLYLVHFSGNYSITYGWNSGWYHDYTCELAIDDENERTIYAHYHLGNFNRDYTCTINKEQMARWDGTFLERISDNAGSKSAAVITYAETEEEACENGRAFLIKNKW